MTGGGGGGEALVWVVVSRLACPSVSDCSEQGITRAPVVAGK